MGGLRLKPKKKNRFAYWFDNKMAGGTGALIKLLSIVAAVTVLIIGILIALAGYGLGDGLFISVTHLMDPGTVAGDDTSHVVFTICMLLVTFFGILLTSTLIGIICNAIDEKVTDLRRGKSVVVEEGHVIVLGSAGGLYTIISELIEANSNHPREALVIMDDKDTKDVMEDKINARFPDKKTTQIICRCGNITDVTDLSVCSFDTCMSVIINAESDAITLKSILAVTSILKECHNDKAYVTAVVRNEQNKEAAELAGKGYVEILSYNDVLSRIIAHTSRYAGLSLVYTDLFDMDGSEFYIEEHKGAVGKTIRDLNRYFPESIVVGFVTAEDEILLNPEPDYTAKPGDRLILFAEDDGVSRMDASPAVVREDTVTSHYVKEPLETIDMVIIGYNSKLKRILSEEDNYVGKGSHVLIALSEAQADKVDILNELSFTNFEFDIKVCDIYNRSELEKIIKPGMRVLVLADDNEEMDLETIEKKDAQILLILLQLRYLSENRGYNLNVTTEMLRVENQELARYTSVNDFVISSNITSLIVTQICQERELKQIFEELLKEEGSEIYVRPAGNYVQLATPTDIYTACDAAGRHREVFIGYRTKDSDTGEFRMITNPPKGQEISFTEEDSFVVISLD